MHSLTSVYAHVLTLIYLFTSPTLPPTHTHTHTYIYRETETETSHATLQNMQPCFRFPGPWFRLDL